MSLVVVGQGIFLAFGQLASTTTFKTGTCHSSPELEQRFIIPYKPSLIHLIQISNE